MVLFTTMAFVTFDENGDQEFTSTNAGISTTKKGWISSISECGEIMNFFV